MNRKSVHFFGRHYSPSKKKRHRIYIEREVRATKKMHGGPLHPNLIPLFHIYFVRYHLPQAFYYGKRF
jgi:hypothetical protein